MKHRRAFFGALDDWIRRHRTSRESSGLFTALGCLLQLTKILELTEADLKTYVLLPGEQNHFTVDRVEKVKSGSDLLAKLKSGLGVNGATIRRLFLSDEFLFVDPNESDLSASLVEYLERLEERKAEADFTAVRLTEIRTERNKVYKEEFKPKKKFGHVETNGSKAKSIILFAHPDSTATGISPSNDESKERVELIKDFDGSWLRERQPAKLNHFFSAILSIVDNNFQIENLELKESRRTLARLLEHLIKMIDQDDFGPPEELDEFRSLLNDERWKIIQDCAKEFLKEHSKTEHPSGQKRLAFLRPSDQKTKKDLRSDSQPEEKSRVNRFLDYADKIKRYFRSPDIKNSALLCPSCPDSTRPFKNDVSLYKHRNRVHGYKISMENKKNNSYDDLPNGTQIGSIFHDHSYHADQPKAPKRIKQQSVRSPKTLKAGQDVTDSSERSATDSIFHDHNYLAMPSTSSAANQLHGNVDLDEFVAPESCDDKIINLLKIPICSVISSDLNRNYLYIFSRISRGVYLCQISQLLNLHGQFVK